MYPACKFMACLKCLLGLIKPTQYENQYENQYEHNSCGILKTRKKGYYKEMCGLNTTQIYLYGLVGPQTYIYAVSFYNVPFCWLKESASNMFMMVFSIAMLCPVYVESSIVMNTLLAGFLSKNGD